MRAIPFIYLKRLLQVIEGEIVLKDMILAFLRIANINVKGWIHPQLTPIKRVKLSGVNLMRRHKNKEIYDIRYPIDVMSCVDS